MMHRIPAATHLGIHRAVVRTAVDRNDVEGADDYLVRWRVMVEDMDEGAPRTREMDLACGEYRMAVVRGIG